MARQFTPRRRSRRWDSLLPVAVNTATTGTQGGSSLAFSTPETVVRMIGGGLFTFDASTTDVGDHARMVVVIGVVSSDAAAVGATALPDPITEANYQWLYFQELTIHAVSGVTAEWASNAASVHRYSFDIKSQRKLTPGQSLVYYAELASTGAPAVWWIAAETRILILES